MKIGGTQYIEEVEPERFFYLKDVFAITNVSFLPVSDSLDIAKGLFLGMSIYSKSFQKGQYTL
jgi:hypothetical protein